MDRELLLRTHIRQLLLPYALKHLTTNYIDHSQSKVSEILSESLDVVPLQDPTFLALSIEPLDAFSSLFRVKEQPPFVETWKVDTEAKTFLLETLGSLSASTKGPTTRCLSFDDDPDPVFEFMSTILTRQAVSQTPEPGKLASNHKKIISTPLTLLKTMNLETAPEEYIEPIVLSEKSRDSLLGVRYSIDKEMHDPVMHLISHVACPPPVDEHHNGTHPSRAFLRDDSPPYDCREHMSPPVFPVNVPPHFRASGPERPSEIQSLGFITKVEFTNDKEEISKEHMQVLNGWTTLPELSSNTPSLGSSSQTTEFDELFALTPNQESLSPKMDEYLIPRVLHPGVDSGKESSRDAARNLFDFLSPLLPGMETIPSSDSVEPQSSHPEIPSSTLGQPSRSHVAHALDRPEHLTPIKPKETPERLRTLIETVCAPVHDESPEDWILSERLEEKETLMMEVPKMKEPRIHPPSPSCPVAPDAPLSLISAPSNAGSEVKPTVSVPALKKVSGTQSLNIELSWRPFNFGSRIPTTEELSNAESFYPSTAPELDALSEVWIKDTVSLLETQGKTGYENLENDDDPSTKFTNTFGGDYDITLTNADRRKIYASFTEASQEMANGMTPENVPLDEDIEESSGDPMLSGKSNKRLRIAPSSVLNGEEPTNSGQVIATVNVPRPHLLSPEIDDNHRSPPQYHDAVNRDRRNDGKYPYNECGENGLHESSCVQQGKEAIFKDSVSSFGYIPSGAKSAAGDLAHRSSPSNLNAPRKRGLPPVRQALTDFLHLRTGSKFKLDNSEPLVYSPPLPSDEDSIYRPQSPPREIPPEIVDANTVVLPSNWSCPAIHLKYIASTNVLQKTVLLQHLELECRINLVERENTDAHNADLIMDVDAALLYVPLSSLHLSKEKLADRIAVLSWRFEFIMVVFEAFSSTTALRPQRLTEGNLTPYAFPPVTLKAIKTLKKLLTVMEMIPSTVNEKKTAKLPSTIVKYAYARDVLEAAKFARLVGDEIGASNLNTEWLSDEYTQDEKDLSCIPGMNIYAAALLLRHTDVSALVNMSSMERLGQFSNILGKKRMMLLNDEIETRLAILASSSQPERVVPLVEEDKEKDLDASFWETGSVELLSEYIDSR